MDEPRVTQGGQARVLTERLQRLRRNLGAVVGLALDNQLPRLLIHHGRQVFGVVAVDVHGQHLAGVHVVLGPILVGTKRAQGKENIQPVFLPLVNRRL